MEFSRQEYWSGLPFPSPRFHIYALICGLLHSHVQLFATPWTVAHQAPLSMGFPGKNTGGGCHFLLQICVNIQYLFLSFWNCYQRSHWPLSPQFGHLCSVLLSDFLVAFDNDKHGCHLKLFCFWPQGHLSILNSCPWDCFLLFLSWTSFSALHTEGSQNLLGWVCT